MSIKRRALGSNTFERDLARIRAAINSTAGSGAPVNDHGLLIGLTDDDHTQYMHNTIDRTVTAQHTFDPTSPGAPFILASNAQGQIVTGLNADELDSLETSSNPGANAAVLVSDSSGYLEIEALGLGGASPSAVAPILSRGGSGVSLQLEYDAVERAQFTVSIGGNLTIRNTGDFVFDPDGFDILPESGYELNVGSLQKKYLTLHVAELWVETLVAQDTIATIGGRILVGPTTSLTRDLTDVATTIYTRHNQLAGGDRAYLEADGLVEFMAVTSEYTQVESTELLSNLGFETAGGGGDDVFDIWTENDDGNDSAIARNATPHTGTYACRIHTRTVNSIGHVYQDFVTEPGERYKVTYWTRGDGSDSGWVKLWDTIAGIDIIGKHTTSISGTTYTEKTLHVTAPDDCTAIRLYLYCSLTDEAMVYYDDVSAVLAENEYYYTVTRNLDGTGANAWYAGAAIFNTGVAGDGFMDIFSLNSIQGAKLHGIYTFSSTTYRYSENLAHKSNFELFPTTNVVADSLFIGFKADNWENVYFNIGTAEVSSEDGLFRWYYRNDVGGWTIFTPTVAPDFTTVGFQALEFNSSGWTTWTPYTIPGTGAESADLYYIRRRLDTIQTTFTTAARQSRKRVQGLSAQWGPTIIGNIRQSSTYNDWEERWVIGNLNGTYGFGTDVYGAAFGDPNADHLVITESTLLILGADGNLVLDNNGMVFTAGTADAATNINSVSWNNGSSDQLAVIGAGQYASNSDHTLWIASMSVAGDESHINMFANSPTGESAGVRIAAGENALTTAYIDILSHTGDTDNVVLAADLILLESTIAAGPQVLINHLAVNTDQTVGLTINQAGYDNEIISLKSTDVAHGITALTETETYGTLHKTGSGDGGLMLSGYGESTLGIVARGHAVSTNTLTSNSARAPVMTQAWVRDGSGPNRQALAVANSNIFCVQNGTNTRFLVDEDGDTYHAGGDFPNDWDDYDDMALVRGLKASLTAPGDFRTKYQDFIAYAEPILEKTGVVKYNRDTDGEPFVSTKGIRGLMLDAIWQLGQQIKTLNKRMTAIEKETR